jgi:YD repeat-containing protein
VNPVLQDNSQSSFLYSDPTVTVTDPSGVKRKSQYDALGRLVSVWEPKGWAGERHPNASGHQVWHNCATDPVLVAKTDFIDDVRLLILRNLLKTKMCPKIPGLTGSPATSRLRFSLNFIRHR